ncbi:MAG: hypothetical protein ACI4KH_05940 [Oscillospiraceae bacterium]
MKASKLSRMIAVFLSTMLLMLTMVSIAPVKVSALAAAKKEVKVLELYPSGCIKTMTVLFQADGRYGTAYGKIGIQKQATSMNYLRPYIPSSGAQSSSSWPATVDKEGFIAFGSGDEFKWSDGNECLVTVNFNDGDIDLNTTADYYIYLWTRAPSYGIYPDLLLRQLKTENGKLLDESGNTIVDDNTHFHSWSNVWESNDTHHWHNCTAEGCDVTSNSGKNGYGEHEFEWGIVEKPTTENEGLLKGVCKKCEKESEKVLPKLTPVGNDDDDENDNGNIFDETPENNVGEAKLDDINYVAENIPITAEEYLKIQDGKNLSIFLEVIDVTDAADTMPQDDKDLINDKISTVSDMQQGMLIDVSLFKKIDGEIDKTKVTETNAPIKITFRMPESLINTDANIIRTYRIIRVHNGVAEIIDGTFNIATKEFTFMTDKFSSYAIAYTDTTIPPAPTTPSSHTHNYKYKYDGKVHWEECALCGRKQVAKEHIFGEWKQVGKSEQKKRTCEVCGYIETSDDIEDLSAGENIKTEEILL